MFDANSGLEVIRVKTAMDLSETVLAIAVSYPLSTYLEKRTIVKACKKDFLNLALGGRLCLKSCLLYSEAEKAPACSR